MLESGIYFDLPASEYHADPALGSSSIKLLAYSPVEFWWRSPMNPLYQEPPESDAMSLGSALHALVLEGREAFDRQFARQASISDYPGALRTVEDMRRFLESRGRKARAYKAEIVSQCLEEADHPPIWPKIEMEFEKANAGKTILPEAVYQRAILQAQYMRTNPEIAPAFQDGFAEVSVFWEVNGVRCKARFDYLKINSSIDLKSFSVKSRGRSIGQSIYSAIASERYDIQAAHYGNARMQMARLVSEGRVFGEHDQKWLRLAADNRNWAWVWVFYKTTDAPIARGHIFDQRSREWESAQYAVRGAIEDYDFYSKRFGSAMWIDETKISTIGEGDLPSWLGL